MKWLWTEDEVTHHGKYFHVRNARPTAKPYQKTYPKIWLAGISDPAIKRIGRDGDTLFIGPVQPKDMIRHQIDLHHATLEENGHPIDMVIVREFFCAGSRDEAMEKARPGFERKHKEYEDHGFQGEHPELTWKITGDLETLMDETFIVGNPQECTEQIA